MSVLSDPRRFRRLLAGLGLTLGPALFVLVELIHPTPDSNAVETYNTVSGNSDQWYLAHAIALVSIALAVPGVLGLMHLLKTTRPGWGHAGTAITLLGLVPLTAIVGMEFIIWKAGHLEQTAGAGLIDAVNDSPGITVVWVLALLFPLGWVTLAVGLYLARTVATWQAALVAVGIVAAFVGDIAYMKWLSIAGAIVFFLGLAPIGYRLLTQTDEEWETGSAVGEFRAVPTA
jgi:hypothetical protein